MLASLQALFFQTADLEESRVEASAPPAVPRGAVVVGEAFADLVVQEGDDSDLAEMAGARQRAEEDLSASAHPA